MTSSSSLIIIICQFLWLVLFFTISSTSSNPTATNGDALNKNKSLEMHPGERTLSLINQTVLGVLTRPIGDFFRPEQFNLQQSTLPLYIILFNIIGNVIAFIIFLYFWKEIYYQVPDPYATVDGPAPPQLKTDEMGSLTNSVLQALHILDRMFQ